jgi:hypothetical protein
MIDFNQVRNCNWNNLRYGEGSLTQGHCIYTRLTIATFWRTFHHDGKISPALVRVGGWRMPLPTPSHYIYHHVQSCSVCSSWEGRNTHISTLPLYVLCGLAYQIDIPVKEVGLQVRGDFKNDKLTEYSSRCCHLLFTITSHRYNFKTEIYETHWQGKFCKFHVEKKFHFFLHLMQKVVPCSCNSDFPSPLRHQFHQYQPSPHFPLPDLFLWEELNQEQLLYLFTR